MNVPGIPLADIVGKAFVSVFDELNLSTEAWFQKTKLLTVGRDRFVAFVTENIGKFPLFGTNRVADISGTYVTVAVSAELEHQKYKPREEIASRLKSQQAGHRGDLPPLALSPLEAINAGRHGFALVGNAGSGKTTAFRYLALATAKGTPLRGVTRLPIYVAVRDINVTDGAIRRAMVRYLTVADVEAADLVLERLLRSSRIALFLDGLDETDSTSRRTLVHELKELKARYPDNVFCLSSRPYTLSFAVPGFVKWETLSMRLPERIEFARKWFGEVDPEKGKAFLDQCHDTPAILDLGSSPLLLGIVCALYYNDLNVPLDPDELYARAVEGLMGGWDAFRNIARATPFGGLTVRRRIVLLTHLAAITFDLGKPVFSASDVQESGVIERLRDVLRVDLPDAEELLLCLYNDFGIIVERAPGLYSFSHLTLHEYLVAVYVIENRAERALVHTHRTKSEWFNVIRLVAKMLPRATHFMTELTDETEVGKRYDVMLLLAAWQTKPVCTKAEIGHLMQRLFDRIGTFIGERSVRAEVLGDTAWIVIGEDNRDVLPDVVASPEDDSLTDLLTLMFKTGVVHGVLRAVSPTMERILAALRDPEVARVFVTCHRQSNAA